MQEKDLNIKTEHDEEKIIEWLKRAIKEQKEENFLHNAFVVIKVI